MQSKIFYSFIIINKKAQLWHMIKLLQGSEAFSLHRFLDRIYDNFSRTKVKLWEEKIKFITAAIA